MLAISVVMAIIFAANTTLPLIALTITKLAAAVGLAKNRNSKPNCSPENPAIHAAHVEATGSTIIFMLLALRATWLPTRMPATESVAPIQINAKGNVNKAK